MNTPEQKARDLLERMEVPGAQDFSAGELVELANLIASQPAQDGDMVTVPRRLTAENGAKYLMMGEFFERITIDCPYCEDGITADGEDCGECSGDNEITREVPVSWTTIKAIYAKAIDHFTNGGKEDVVILSKEEILLRLKDMNLSSVARESGVGYGTLWRLTTKEDANTSYDTIEKLSHYFIGRSTGPKTEESAPCRQPSK